MMINHVTYEFVLDLYTKADKGGPLLGLSGGELPPWDTGFEKK